MLYDCFCVITPSLLSINNSLRITFKRMQMKATFGYLHSFACQTWRGCYLMITVQRFSSFLFPSAGWQTRNTRSLSRITPLAVFKKKLPLIKEVLLCNKRRSSLRRHSNWLWRLLQRGTFYCQQVQGYRKKKKNSDTHHFVSAVPEEVTQVQILQVHTHRTHSATVAPDCISRVLRCGDIGGSSQKSARSHLLRSEPRPAALWGSADWLSGGGRAEQRAARTGETVQCGAVRGGGGGHVFMGH